MENDELNSPEILKFQNFVGQNTDVLKYLHNTKSEEIAKKIIENGFRFEKYLENTTDLVSGLQIVELRYFNHIRRSYGDYTIIIHIGKSVVEKYTNKLKGTNFHYTEALTLIEPVLSSDDEYIYTLPGQFVKGYINQKEMTIFKNKNFDPYFDAVQFEKNIRELQKYS